MEKQEKLEEKVKKYESEIKTLLKFNEEQEEEADKLDEELYETKNMYEDLKKDAEQTKGKNQEQEKHIEEYEVFVQEALDKVEDLGEENKRLKSSRGGRTKNVSCNVKKLKADSDSAQMLAGLLMFELDRQYTKEHGDVNKVVKEFESGGSFKIPSTKNIVVESYRFSDDQ